ncbi:MAG: hypothetical protein JWM90_2881 [Thermoleophilia bacterium]|nr:hypothetical protein [Thermoleophilia bacterium]
MCARPSEHRVELESSGRGETGTDSSLEALTLKIIRMARFPEPLVNFRIDINGQLRRVDLYWPEYDLVVEVNGWGHRRARARAMDAQLRRDLTARGIRVLTVTEDQVRNDPTSVVTLLEPMFAGLLLGRTESEVWRLSRPMRE